MSQAIHLITNNVPGYGPSESRRPPHSGTSAKSVAVFPLSLSSNNRAYSKVKIGTLKYPSGAAFFVCRASSGGPRRNSDYSKQNRQSFSRNRNRHYEDKDNFENLDESDLLTSKNGPLVSLSNTSKFQTTATPGPREKEIVELFRKVQAQLRERAAEKEGKKVKTAKGKGKESETIDSLLKLLRKHSTEESKKNVSNINGGDLVLDQPEQNETESEIKSTEKSKKNVSNINGGDLVLDQPEQNETESEIKSTDPENRVIAQPNATPPSRPPSNFRRKSPVPKVKFDSINSKKKPFEKVPDSEEQPLLDIEETESEQKSSSYNGEGVLNELSKGELSDTENDDEEQEKEQEDLSSMKLVELRALAKSRGIKGFSKMKKGDLVELLSSK